ncbi:erythrocyte membrane protein 1, PfEMP1, putative [Plasmodium sp.]|nr:erythrocyte membrane protein 1, PfEMP1, putative [Plasmodium sp.]
MGSQSSKSSKPSVVPTESYKSPRNILEDFAESIKQQAVNELEQNQHHLKGDLTQAVFRDAHFRKGSKQKYDNPYLCFLDYRWNTNLGKEWVYERHPCHSREQNRFDEDQESECSNIYIRGDGNDSKATACAPPRRRHMCDKNLEAINERNTQNVHDLLGNVLVTAKYEGESIVNNHPHEGTSEVCISLARSFADIGDIVRGKDMFKPNDQDEVWKGLRSVFKKINDNLKEKGINNYDDKYGNYFKLREDWWTANRNKVWDAITCNAPYKPGYFRQSKDNKQLFSDYKCGHKQGNVPTNLDYVPQYLRWFDEWGEEFCRKRNIKLINVKNECRDEQKKKYCGRNGYDCTQINRKKNLPRGSKCTNCWAKCNLYESWLHNQQETFDKQKEKYAKEINVQDSTNDNTNNSINNKYYENFYEKFKDKYDTVNEFINLLNEGKYCNKKEKTEEENIDFTKTDDKEGTFYRSKYCQVCPYCGVTCNGTTCTPKEEKYPNCENNKAYVTPEGATTTKINVLYSGDEQGDIIKKLSEFCNDPTDYEGKNYQKWQCHYKSRKGIKCQMTSIKQKDRKHPDVMIFDEFFDLWVTYFLTETITWKDRLKKCMNNTKTPDCIDECNKHCVCFDKWVNQKEQEWNIIKEQLRKERNMLQQYYLNINDLFDSFLFQVMNKLHRKEAKWKEHIGNLRKKIESSKSNKGNKDSEAAIELLFEYLKETATICKDNNTNEACDLSLNPKANPCKDKNDGTQPTKNVKQIAQYYKRLAYAQLEEHGSRGALKGDASKGYYTQGGEAIDFKNKLCKITKEHSNCSYKFSDEPCGGKDNDETMFNIKEGWKSGKDLQMSDNDVFMPPRRQHFCTSNLEFLETSDYPFSTNNAKLINDSFLGDVLLSAKSEADFIKKKYEGKKSLEGFKDEKTICQAVRYSFADLGDIIRGKDMWDKDQGTINMESHLLPIFKKIKEEHRGIKKNPKYKDNIKYLDLRKDWWEANRDQVWKAMSCEKNGINCDKGETPLDDYIPQRLRWMTEFAEWYCKVQSQANEACGGCLYKGMSGKNGNKKDPECEKCKTAIDAYKAKIDPWKKQWNNLEKQYSTLYANAQIAAGKGGPRYYIARVQKKDKSVFKFLYDLYIQNGGIVGPPPVPFSETTEILPTNINTPYDNAGAYVHDTGNLSDCKEGKEFCNRAIRFNAIKNKLKEDDDSSDSESETKPPAPSPDVDEVCKIVEGILTVDTLKEACSRKYVNGKEKFPNWKCVTTTNGEGDGRGPSRNKRHITGESDTAASGSGLCIPPRRRKLYIHKVDNGITDDASLRKWFIETAAIETFFLWDRYKKIKQKEKEEELQRKSGLVGALARGIGLSADDEEEPPQKKLEEGEIPEEFKRQMFYTLADYRDILEGKNDIVIGNTGSGIAKDEMSQREQKVRTAISSYFQKISKQNGGVPSSSGDPNSDERKKCWKTNAKYIWEGMICALTYKENGSGGEKNTTISQDSGLKDKFLDTNNKPKQNGTQDYTYDGVKLDNSVDGRRTNDNETTTLVDFTSRPPYFRYLEEWGEQFCREKRRRLEEVKDNCMHGDKQKYSGNGEACNEMLPENDGTLRGLEGQSCAISCRSYKKWIKKKKTEYEKQKKSYDVQKITYVNENTVAKNKSDKTSDNGLSKKLTTCTTAAAFLQRLRSCFKTDNDNGKGKQIFEDNGDTFEPAKDCKPCSEFKVKCENHNCGSGQKKEKCTGNNKRITVDDIKNGGNSIENVDMRVSHNNTNGNKFDDLKDCKSTDIFEGIKKEQWKCRNVCGLDVCGLTNGNGSIDENQIILIRALVKRWVEHFLEDYNRINKKLKTCINSSEQTICKYNCENKCNCVHKWIEEKKKEWKIVRNRFFKQYNLNESNIYEVNSFIKGNVYPSDVKNVLDEGEDIEKLKESCGCTNTKNTKDEECEKKDAIEILLDRLKKKTQSCHNPSSGDTQAKCEKYTPVEYGDDESLEEDEENENQVTQPKICPKPTQPPPQPEVEDGCKPAQTTPEEPKEPGVCERVKSLIGENDGTTEIDGCKRKENYPGWNCAENSFLSGNEGTCMPPRRQKLCIHDLENNTIENEMKLKEFFINDSAKEIFLLWKYYKETNNNINDRTLEEGTIPEEFFNIMKYTYGDYKDLLFGTDISNSAGINKVRNHINTVFPQTKGVDARKEWWETNGPKIWEGMLCALTHKISDEEKKNKIKTTYKDPPHDFAKNPQFLRWFTEWSDKFCRQYKVKKAKLLNKCEKVDCNNKEKHHETTKQECEKECKEYHEWIKDWKDKYNKQKGKFDKEKKDKTFDNTPAADDVEYVSSAHEYLHEQLEKLCKDEKCSCMEETSTKDEVTDLAGNNDFPKALDNPPEEIEKQCECSESSEPMSCVEKTALKLRKIAEKNIDAKLKGNGNRYNDNCKEITKDKYQDRNGGKCKFKGSLSSIGITNNECENTGKDRFKIGGEWDCNGKTLDGNNKLCIPPRRKDMCLKKLENKVSTNISYSTELLKKIQDVAKSEGDDIIHKLLEQNPCNESIICDAMKYSFADLADIIRDTNIYKGPNGTNVLEKELKSVFETIYTKWKSENTNNESKYPDLASFRSAWWDANRKDIWKAMTCSAPKDAHLKKKLNNPADKSPNIDSIMAKQEKCGYDKEPPDYDYIPELYRFLQEWSEYYCKALNKKKDEIQKECPECLKKGTKCEKENKEKCKECNDKCEKYKELVHTWQSQFEQQNQIYKKLYTEARSYGTSSARRDFSIKFIQQLDKICEDPNTAEKYLDKSTHCTDYKFSETNSNGSNYAFSPYPNDYKEQCKCNETPLPIQYGNNLISFIKNSIDFPDVPGLNTIKKAVPRIPKRIKNIRPDAHTIHELVARTFTYFVPFFQTDDKTPPTHNILNDVLPSAIPVGIALALTSIAFLYLKKKSKSSVDFLRVLNIPKGEYEMPTLKSSNRYIPYASDRYKGKTYIYMEGDSGDEDKYMFLADSTDITSSESEYEELDINDIYVPDSPKYKTLIEVVLEPSKRDIPSNDIQPTNKFTDEEWSELKHDFISQYLPNTEPNTLYFDKPEEKPFITSIHDRDLYTGEEISYNINMTNTNNDIPMSDKNGTYTGIDLINDSLSGEPIDIYDEVLKRKENELFGTKHPKRTSKNSVITSTNSDSVMNQIDLFHTWLDRHRDMCEQWNNKEDILNKLNEEWNKDNDIGNVPIDNKTLNTNVSIQIDMDHGKPKKEFTNMDTNMDTPTMDTILDDLEKYNEPYYDVQDDIYYDVNDHDTSTVDSNNMDVPSKVQIEMDVNNKLVKEKYPIADVWDI